MDDENFALPDGRPAGSWPVLGQRKSRWGNEAVSDGKTEELNFRKCMDGFQFRDILNVPLSRNKA